MVAMWSLTLLIHFQLGFIFCANHLSISIHLSLYSFTPLGLREVIFPSLFLSGRINMLGKPPALHILLTNTHTKTPSINVSEKLVQPPSHQRIITGTRSYFIHLFFSCCGFMRKKNKYLNCYLPNGRDYYFSLATQKAVRWNNSLIILMASWLVAQGCLMNWNHMLVEPDLNEMIAKHPRPKTTLFQPIWKDVFHHHSLIS